MPSRRFTTQDELVHDLASGLTWTRNALPHGFPMPWAEALSAVAAMNARAAHGHTDWRLPNRRELNSLADRSRALPSLPEGHPFSEVWQGWYWTGTTAARAPAYAWRLQLSGGRLFYGNKTEDACLWPVRGECALWRTGQDRCFGVDGQAVACAGTGQDGELRAGRAWPEPRFTQAPGGLLDGVSGLVWRKEADLGGLADLAEAQERTADLAAREGLPWRLPTIDEWELLTDCSRADPALPGHEGGGRPFQGVGQAYWSATASGFEAGWNFCCYLDKGALGVCAHAKREFSVWPVYAPEESLKA